MTLTFAELWSAERMDTIAILKAGFFYILTSERIACALVYKYIEFGRQIFFYCTVFDL